MRPGLPVPLALALLLFSCRERDGTAPAAGDSGQRTTVPRYDRPDPPPAPPRASPRERLEEALALPDAPARDRALEAVAWEAVELDPELAREAIDALPAGGPGARRLIGHLAMRLADEDLDTALEWARGFDHPDERGEAFARLALILANEDPPRAAAMVSGEIPAGRTRDRAAVQVVQRWMQQDPAAAGNWILTHPPGPARRAGLRELVNYWISRSPDQATAWIAAIDDAAARDEALALVGGDSR